ncbi:MAG: Aspartate aminotransferase [Methanomassiliicoccales archaeon PtaU1.Bin124]|nr:MAG: Aspartate aminotransferase [Methanomassiliicoccales archaeon PtaU1.Bin124]
MDPNELARIEVQRSARPVHGGLGWKYPGVEDFSSNLNPYGPPAQLAQYIDEARDRLIWYPDDHSTEFRNAICSRLGVAPDQVIAGAGSAELIRLFPETFLDRGDKVLMPRPTFAEYGYGCRLRGAEVIEVPLREDNDLRIDLTEMMSRLQGCKAAYICNPNNPTGRVLSRKEVLEFASECERRKALLFLDETLLELVPGSKDITCIAEVGSRDNIFLIRSLTKCFAMPGMRIGYGIGNDRIVRLMDSARLSWNLGQLEQHVGAKLLTDCYGHISKAAEMMGKERSRMAKEISATGLVNIREPDSFFFFGRCNGRTGLEMQEELLGQNVLVRDCASFGHPFEHYVRFSVKTPERNSSLIEAFRRAGGV